MPLNLTAPRCLALLAMALPASLLQASITEVNESGLGGDAAAIIAPSFGEDALSFSDRTHQHNGAAFNGSGLATGGDTIVALPEYLLGHDYVRFANNARDQDTYSAEVVSDVTSHFYLLVDNRVNGPSGNTSSSNGTDPSLGGTLQWVIDGGWERVNTGISPGGAADYTGVDEGGDSVGAGQGLNQFYSVFLLANRTSVTVRNNGVGGSNMVSLVVAPSLGVGPTGPDSDDDGLPDDWEETQFGNLNQSASDDPDSDGLANDEEYGQETDPNLSDTDNDGLSDGEEVNQHETDPLLVDTDEDGLTDGAEINSHGSNPLARDTDQDVLDDFAEVMTHGTSPSKPDTDSDGFSDGVEVSAGSDPNNAESQPAFKPSQEVVINEFMASNATTRTDENGDSSDWIELWNPNEAPVDVSGWFLSNDANQLTKWSLPGFTMAPRSFFVISASGKDRTVSADWHTNFRLDRAAGGFIALSKPIAAGGAEVVHAYENLDRQREDVSFGLTGTEPPFTNGYFRMPTPGTPNSDNSVAGFVRDTKFSVDRGFYDAPFTLTIACATPGATIIYTTDGSPPSNSPRRGTRVPAANPNTPPIATIDIATTTNVRAMAVQIGFESSNIDTHTYLFRDAVLQQSNATVPAHANWGHAGPDFEMDPNIVNHSNPEIRPETADFLRVPTVSLTMDWDSMFGNGGIYIAGEGVDRPTSIEYLNPNSDLKRPNEAEGFQIEGTVRIVGGSSTGRWKSDKLSMRLKFTKDLRFPLFGNERTDRFDTLVLDHRLNNVWHYNRRADQRDRAQYTHDQFPADLHTLMGGVSPEGHHCLLYINGVLWGITELHERPDDNFAAEYLGGDNGDYDVMKHRIGTVVSGSNANYRDMLSRTRRLMSSPANYIAVTEVLDIENFIAYMLANYYVGNTDWAHQNWYASYNRVSADGKWHYHSWDPEHCMESTNHDVTSRNDSNGPTEVFHNLIANPEFRLLFADRVHQHFHGDGVLTPANVVTAYMRRANVVDLLSRIESARWGDNGRSNPYTRLDWLHVRDQLLGTATGNSFYNYFPRRTGVVLEQFRNRGWYPDTEPPMLSPSPGVVDQNTALQLASSSGGVIYYTLDGSDPRKPLLEEADPSTTTRLVTETATKFAAVPQDDSQRSTWMTRTFNHDGWASGTEGAGYEESNNGAYVDLIDNALDFGDEVNDNGQETLYLRVPFNASAVESFGSLELGIRYDDGFVAYLNGTEIARANAPGNVGTLLDHDTNASTSHSDNDAVEFASFNVSEHLGALRNGTNVLAIHGLNRGTSSSDILIWPTLIASDEPDASAGEIAETAQRYQTPITLTESAQIRARTLRNGEWSPLSEGAFLVGSVAATSANLRITEVHYHPSAPTEAEMAAGHERKSDFEFIEITNISATKSVHLLGTSFASGVEFETDRHAYFLEIGPRESVVLVEDRAAFENRYGSEIPVVGTFQLGTQLSNAGETIELRGGNGQTIQSLAYVDEAPWPLEADGAGKSLTLIDPLAPDTPTQARQWTASQEIGGTPGRLETEVPIEDFSLNLKTVGQGTLTASPQSDRYTDGQTVTLTPQAAPGWEFEQWSGDASGTEVPLIVTMNTDTGVTATFKQQLRFTLTTEIIGNGSVNASPQQADYALGDTITLTATPSTGAIFQSWSGAASGTESPITLTLDANQQVTATFVNVWPLTLEPTTGGTVTLSPNLSQHIDGTSVALTALPEDGFQFTGWTGALSGTSNPANLVMTGNFTVRPAFTRNLTPLETWQHTHFSEAERTNASISGNTADPDGDGMANILEFLSGTDPQDPRALPRITALVREDNIIEIQWTRPSALSNRTATWSMELSQELTTWQSSDSSPESIIENGNETLVFRSNARVTIAHYARLRIDLE